MVPNSTLPNLLLSGRMIDADAVARGAIQVMVSLNQTGEAASTAAVLALRRNGTAAEVDTTVLRHSLADGGSVMI